MASGSAKVILTAFLANLGLGIAKFFGAGIAGSASLFAEGIHSLVDCTNQLLILFGRRVAKRPPTKTHPLGYGRENFFWSLVVAVLLFTLGGLFALYEGFHKLANPTPLNHPWVAILILILGLFLEGYALRTCLAEVRRINPHKSLSTWFRKTASVDLLVIFTEDMAALTGLVCAIICLVIAWFTGDPKWDAFGSIVIGTLLVIVPIFLAAEVKSLLIGESPSIDYRAPIELIVKETFPDGSILNLIALQTGSDEVMLAYKLDPKSDCSAVQLIEGINEIERKVRAKYPEVRWQFVEPDNAD